MSRDDVTFASFYDFYDGPEHRRQQLAMYRAVTGEAGRGILELACGTGIITIDLARTGSDVTGLDISETMLAIAGRKVAELPPPARSRVRLVKADMARFDLTRRFAMVFIADNSFRELPTRKDLLACLRCIRWHLRGGGRLLITERRLRPEQYPGGVRRFGFSRPTRDPATGALVCRRAIAQTSGPYRSRRAGTAAASPCETRWRRVEGSGMGDLDRGPIFGRGECEGFMVTWST